VSTLEELAEVDLQVVKLTGAIETLNAEAGRFEGFNRNVLRTASELLCRERMEAMGRMQELENRLSHEQMEERARIRPMILRATGAKA